MQVGKTDAILTDAHLDAKIEICIVMNVIVPKLEHAGELREANAKFVNQVETVQMAASKTILRCAKYDGNNCVKRKTRNAPTKENRDVRKLKWKYRVQNMPEKSCQP